MRSGSKITCRGIRDSASRSVLGITAKAIEVIVETGDSGPLTPIGINLPNDQAIREQYGSKSVSLFNVNEAYEESTPEGMRTEFSWTAEEAARAKKWGAFSQELATEMHEVIGHGSGRMAEGVASPHLLLKEQYSAVEESRADLVALYFLADPKLVELGIARPDDHAEIVRTAFEYYARNALVQLRRVRQGTTIEEDHMRNRQMIVGWLIAHTAAIDVRTPRRQDVLRHDRRRRVPRGGRATARRSAADQERGRLRSGEDAVRYLRRAFRSRASRRGRRARRRAAAAVLHRVRHAAA